MNNYDIFLSINGKKIKGNVVNESYTSSVGDYEGCYDELELLEKLLELKNE